MNLASIIVAIIFGSLALYYAFRFASRKEVSYWFNEAKTELLTFDGLLHTSLNGKSVTALTVFDIFLWNSGTSAWDRSEVQSFSIQFQGEDFVVELGDVRV